MSIFQWSPVVGILVLSSDIWTPTSWLNGKISKSSLPQLFKKSVYNLVLYPLVLFITVFLVKIIHSHSRKILKQEKTKGENYKQLKFCK